MLVPILASIDVCGSILLYFLIGFQAESSFLRGEASSGWDSELLDVLLVNVIRGSLLWGLFVLAGQQARQSVLQLPKSETYRRFPAGFTGLVLVLVTSLVYESIKIGMAAHQGLGGPSRSQSVSIVFVVMSLTLNVLEIAVSATSIPKHLANIQRKTVLSLAINESTSDGDEKGEAKEKKSKKSELVRLMKLSKPESWILFWGFVNLIISSASFVAGPYYFGLIINAATDGDSYTITEYCLYLVVIYGIGAISSFFRSWLFTLAGQRLVARIRSQLFDAIIKQEIAFFDSNRTGELNNRLASDTAVIQSTFTVNISMLIRYIAQIFGSLAIMFFVSARLTGVLLAVVPAVAIGAVWYGKRVKNLSKDFQDALGEASSTAEENLSNMRTVRSFANEPKASTLYKRDIDKSYDVGAKLSIVIGGFNGLISLFAQLAMLLVLWYGALQVLHGNLSAGLLTSFMIYTLSVAMACAFLASLYGDFMTAVGASVRIFELLDRKPAPVQSVLVEPPLVLMPEEFTASLEFQSVSFTYPTRQETPVLQNISFRAPAGSVTALVGSSGGGKSTIISLVERFYDPIQGQVLVAGQNLQHFDIKWIRSRIALVGQEPVLFACSIAENIRYGRATATDQEVEEAAKLANAHTFVMSFQEGYKTMVGERGVRLSGGQKQRIAIARALLMDPSILLLDEATSALDSESEHLVKQAIDVLMVNRTVIVIAHRLSTIRNADQIVVIDKGTVVESGKHQELLDLNGSYRRLVDRQLQTIAD